MSFKSSCILCTPGSKIFIQIFSWQPEANLTSFYMGYVDITQGLHSGSFIFFASNNVETNLQMH